MFLKVPEEAENVDGDNVVETDASESPLPITEPDLTNQPTLDAEEIHDQTIMNVIPQQSASLPPQMNLASRTAVNTEAPAPNAVPAPAFPPPQHQQMTPSMQPIPAQVIC